MSLQRLQNDIKESFLDEKPVSTILNATLEGVYAVDEWKTFNLLLSTINEKGHYKGKKICLNFQGQNGLYFSKTRYSNFMKFTIIKNGIEEFEKENKRIKVIWTLSNPVYFPETPLVFTSI